MPKIDWSYYRELKKEFIDEKVPAVEAVGYHVACGFGFAEGLEQKICLAVRLQPLLGSPDPIEDDLLARIKTEILTDNYKGVPLDIKYTGMIRARKK